MGAVRGGGGSLDLFRNWTPTEGLLSFPRPGLGARQVAGARITRDGEPPSPPMPQDVRHGGVPAPGYLSCFSAYSAAKNTTWLCQRVPPRSCHEAGGQVP